MANRYWVGGTGAWDATSTTNWSASSGGASGASVPTAADSVFFDQAGTYTVTLSSAACLDITVSAGTVTFASAGAITFTIYGSMTLIAGTVWSADTSFSFKATTTGKTVTTNGTNFSSATMEFFGNGGGWTLGSALTLSGILYVTQGSLGTGNYAVSASNIWVIATNTKSLSLGSSTITLTGGVNFDATNTTFNSGTSQINITGTGPSFAGAGLTFRNVSFTSNASTGSYITGANTFNNLSFTGRASTGLAICQLAANQTITGTLTVSAGADSYCRTMFRSDLFLTTRTLTVATFAGGSADVDFQDITVAGAAAPISGTRFGNAGGNTGITFSTPKTVYWNLSGPQNWNATAWATSSGGPPGGNNYPLPQDTAVFDDAGSVTGTISLASGSWFLSTVDMSARTLPMTINTGTNTLYLIGGWKNGTGTTLTATGGAFVFAGGVAQDIQSNGVSFPQQLSFQGPGGTYTLLDACTCTSSAVSGLSAGTLDLAGYTLTIASNSTFATSGTRTKNITFNGGSITITGSGSAFNNAGVTGFSTTAGSGMGYINLTSASPKTFVGGGVTFNCALNQGGAGALTISSSNTFRDITNTYAYTGAATITVNALSTITVANFTAKGGPGKVLTLNSTSAGNRATIALTGGGRITTDYLAVQDMAFTPAPATDGTTPYYWYLGANSTNNGNNTGGAFVAGTARVYQITNTATTSWTAPSDWNSSSNTIYLIGGGGGGATSAVSGNNRAAGGGGGGGGYTVVSNFSATPSSSITVAVGISGAANNDGGNTSWSAGAFVAGGGKKGTADTTPTSAGGVGGTGTFAGGAGGAGAFGTTASQGYGAGGGGGAGGPSGVGGSGGIGFGSTTAANVAGGGGGGNGGGANGGNAASATFGSGGNNVGATGGGATAGAAGTVGGGGAGNVNVSAGGAGGSGIDILKTIGGAGGRGGGGAVAATINAGLYGGGGAGGGVATAGTTYAGGAGSQGAIIISYTPAVTATSTNFLFFFPIQ